MALEGQIRSETTVDTNRVTKGPQRALWGEEEESNSSPSTQTIVRGCVLANRPARARAFLRAPATSAHVARSHHAPTRLPEPYHDAPYDAAEVYLALGEAACEALVGETTTRADVGTHSPLRRNRRLGCPGCGQGRGLTPALDACSLCGWSVAGHVAKCWPESKQREWREKTAAALLRGDDCADRIAFEEVRYG